MSDVTFRKLAREMSGKQNSSSSILLLTVISLIAVILIWAATTELDNVVRGDGKTVSEAQNQLVQSAERGVIRARYVTEGDIVKKGDLLFDIDPIDAKTELQQSQMRFASLSIKSIRLKAEVQGKTPDFPDDLIEVAPNSISTELALYRARLDDKNTKTAILEQRRIQKLNEINGLKMQFESAVTSQNLIKKQISTLEPLVKAGLAAETRLISLQREEEAENAKATTAESGQEGLSAALEEINEQLNATNQSYLTSALTDLSSIEGEMAELAAGIPALEQRVERTSVKSPINGIINRLNYVTADAYVNTGDVLLEIVPTGTKLIVETRIDPKDIADLIVGNEVKISLTAYNPNDFGRIDGKVLNVSADAITDNQTGLEYYQVDVSIDGSLYEDDGSEVVILPGMVASIDVLAGKRTVLDYFWQPIANTKSKALRD